MKLLDQVAQAGTAITIEDDTGRHLVPGAGCFAGAIAACRTRFIADPNVAAFCRSLLKSDRGMFAACNDFLRLPQSPLWIEWPCEPIADTLSGTRSGVLVEADEDGRSGRLTTFWEQKMGVPVVAQMIATFDLDNEGMAADAPIGTWVVRPGSHPLASHLVFAPTPGWERHLVGLPTAVALSVAGRIISDILPGLEFVFAFSALLAERTCLGQQPVDLARLNRQRQRKGNPPLLDHCEVWLDIAPDDGAQRTEASREREPARLHAVRGHMVHRSGHSFWRRSHLRGDPSRAGWTRTVQVTHTTIASFPRT